MKKIAVLGSINIDLVVSVPRFLKPGETLTGTAFNSFEGGKGANQAVALAKLGANVSMLGKVGNDTYGQHSLKYFDKLKLKCNHIESVENAPTGTAVITVADDGQNSIAVVAGANGLVDKTYINSKTAVIKEHDYLLLQLEIPLESVIHAAKTAYESNTLVILDPAPAAALPDDLYKYVEYITPNETETEILTGIKVNNKNDAIKAADFFLSKGVKNIIIKAGKAGAYLFLNNTRFFVPGFTVSVKDTTAAGDTFNGAFTYALAEGKSPEQAVLFANAASALKITGFGAQGSMPAAKDVVKFIQTQSNIKPSEF